LVYTEHKADTNEFLLALIDPLLPEVQVLVQPTKALQKRLRGLRRTLKPGRDPLEDWEGIHSYHLKPSTLLGRQGRRRIGKQVTGILVLAYHDRRTLGPVGIEQLRREAFLGQPTRKPAKSLLYVTEPITGICVSG
jgi:hypothetical protein